LFASVHFSPFPLLFLFSVSFFIPLFHFSDLLPFSIVSSPPLYPLFSLYSFFLLPSEPV
jgi:hypothetical protein